MLTHLGHCSCAGASHLRLAQQFNGSQQLHPSLECGCTAPAALSLASKVMQCGGTTDDRLGWWQVQVRQLCSYQLSATLSAAAACFAGVLNYSKAAGCCCVQHPTWGTAAPHAADPPWCRVWRILVLKLSLRYRWKRALA